MLINIHTHQFTGRQIEVVNRSFGGVYETYYSFGIHPWDAEKWKNKLPDIQSNANNNKCLALGEIGLDKLKGPEINLQQEIFIQQIAISEDLNLPVILHCVRSWNELKQLKRSLKPKQQWIFHGFTKASLMDDVLNEGLMISIGAAILTNQQLQEKIRMIPVNKLFLETDDSDQPISLIYAKVSELLNLPLLQLESQIEDNFKRIFTKWTIG